MSLRSLLNRTVSWIRTTQGTEDRYGNASTVDAAPVAGIPARRDQVGAGEDQRDRDQQARTFVYTLPLRASDGTLLEPTGRDRLVDGAETFEIVGSPELLYRRRRPHHWELTAVLVEG